tara:strand:+ start:186 stop:575 length:390 start_codon:yes stop_codon:yes gene_type:complete
MLTAAIISSLLNWIELNTHYNTKNFKTKIVEVSKKEIQKIACGGKCPIIAFYKPEEAIYISKMNFEKNYCNQSILLHEMIHVLQSKKIENVFKEKEAYLLQNKFLLEKSDSENLHFKLNVRKCRSIQKI